MKAMRALYVAAIAAGMAALLAAGAAQLSAQQAADPAIQIGADDLGGVVTSANGPGGRRLGDRGDHRSAHQVRQDRRHRRSRPLPHARSAEGELQRLGARLRAGRFAEGADRARARSLEPDSGRRAERGGGGGILSGDLLVFAAQDPGQERVPRHRARGQRHRRRREEPGAVARHRQDRRLLIVSSARQQGDAHDPEGARRTSSPRPRPGSGASSPDRPDARWSAASAGSTRSARSTLFADWTDRIAAGELPSAKPPRPQGVERNVVVTLWDWATPKAYLHDEIATDKRNPTVNANGLIYGAPEESTDLFPVLDPVRHTASEVKMPVRDPNTPSVEGRSDGAVAVLGRRSRSGTARPACTTRCSTRRAGSGSPRASVRRTIRPSARRARTIRRRSCSRSNSAGRHLSMYDPKTGKFTLIGTCFTTHHLHLRRGRQQHAVDQQRRSAAAAWSAG